MIQINIKKYFDFDHIYFFIKSEQNTDYLSNLEVFYLGEVFNLLLEL